MNTIFNGDSLKELKKLEDNSVDLLCTDPPYGYSFMGKDWDKAVPSVEVWKECLRVLKPGAFAFIMSAPRSDVLSRMIVRIEDAGFRVDFTPLYWTYASGFPKAMNIGKMVDKRLGSERGRVPLNQRELRRNITTRATEGRADLVTDRPDDSPATPQAKALDGSYGGFQPKPAVEVIIVAMKPLSEKTYVDQALKNGKGITWLDECRILERVTSDLEAVKWSIGESGANIMAQCPSASLSTTLTTTKKTTALRTLHSLMLSLTNESIVGVKSEKENGGSPAASVASLRKWLLTITNESQELALGASRVAYKMLSLISEEENWKPHSNIHSTVKPIILMSYLITLGSRGGDTILDPFLGSGTTALAAKNLGRKYIGIEQEKDYAEIAEARLAAIPQTLFT
jgi:hypothetical protein